MERLGTEAAPFPIVVQSDTYCQLLRLPRSRLDLLETANPALAFKARHCLARAVDQRTSGSLADPSPRQYGAHTLRSALMCPR